MLEKETIHGRDWTDVSRELQKMMPKQSQSKLRSKEVVKKYSDFKIMFSRFKDTESQFRTFLSSGSFASQLILVQRSVLPRSPYLVAFIAFLEK